MQITASKLRENTYAVLDRVIETGVPVEIRWKGSLLRIVPEKAGSKLSRLKKRECIVGDSEELVHMDWTGLWTERK